MSNLRTPPIARIFLCQSAATLLLGFAFYFLADKNVALSVVTGALISLIPYTYFAFKAFAYIGAQAMHRTVANIYIGEMVKLILTACGFALAFLYLNTINVLALFLGFIFVHLSGIAASINLPYAGKNMAITESRS